MLCKNTWLESNIEEQWHEYDKNIYPYLNAGEIKNSKYGEVGDHGNRLQECNFSVAW